MPDVSPVRDLADRLAAVLLAADPFAGTALGLRQYDALVPDPSAAAEDALAKELVTLEAEAAGLTPETVAERLTLDAVRATCHRQQLDLEGRAAEYTVTAMPLAGPPQLFATAARTVLADARAAHDYLARLRASAAWIDGGTQRLREGRERGRFPVATLVDQAIGWVDRATVAPVPGAFTGPRPPVDGVDVEHWTAERDRVVTGEIVPAVLRWRDLLVELRLSARPDDAAGMRELPDGAADYARAIEYHTTLPLTADELHATGLAEVERLESRARSLGATLGLFDLPAVVAAVRASSSATSVDVALDAARAAIARAEARAPEIMPAPMPPPCAVAPMPSTVAETGMAPHYTRPTEDGARPGTFWFNTMRPTAGTGWDLEAVAFHEAVPGHHSQLARAQALRDLPLLQQMPVTAHAEGWGLYAERLAGEFGLYSDTRAELGAVYMEMMRAARLVVDTGLHALGWTRRQAIEFLVAHIALPESLLTNEIDRYLAWPGQALAYLTGLLEIVRLRTEAEATLGDDFDLPAFNGVLLDSGSLPLPVLGTAVAAWIRR